MCNGTILTLILTPRAHYAAPSNRPLSLLLSVHRPITRPLIASDLTLEELRQHRRATCAHPSEEFVDFKNVIMWDGKIASHRMLLSSCQMPMTLPLVFLHCSLAQPSSRFRCGNLRANLKRAKRRTVLQSGMYNINSDVRYVYECT